MPRARELKQSADRQQEIGLAIRPVNGGRPHPAAQILGAAAEALIDLIAQRRVMRRQVGGVISPGLRLGREQRRLDVSLKFAW